MNQITEIESVSSLSDEARFDHIEDRLRADFRATIEAMFEEKIAEFARTPSLRPEMGRKTRLTKTDTTAKATANGNSPAPST